MASAYRDSVLLEPRRFDESTRNWNVPILMIRGVKIRELYIDGSLIPLGDYSVRSNHLSLSDRYSVNGDTRAQLVVEYNPTNMLIVFWLPIIVAIIGFLGAVGQPILHNVGVLYTPEMEVNPKGWGYLFDSHNFKLELLVKNLKPSDKREWVMYVAVRRQDDAIDPRNAEFVYISGPFSLKDNMTILTPTHSDFTAEIARDRASVEAAIFLAKQGTHLASPFQPWRYPESQLRLVGIRSEAIPDGTIIGPLKD